MGLILRILENPIRRRIIERLSQEPNYTLQLSKELGLGQQLVAKHLNIMEDSGLVTSLSKSSPSGPQRKIYVLNKSFSVTLDLAPNLFKQKIVFFDVEPEKHQLSESLASLMERRNIIANYPEKRDKITPFSEILAEIDEKVETLEEERVLLLSIRKSVMKEMSKITELWQILVLNVLLTQKWILKHENSTL